MSRWRTTPGEGAACGEVPAIADLKAWQRDEKGLVQRAVASAVTSLVLKHSAVTGVVMVPGDDAGVFARRVSERARELRDDEVAAITAKFKPKLERAAAAVDKARAKVDAADDKRSAQSMSAAADVGVSILSAMFGGRRSVAATARKAVRGASQRSQSSATVAQAEKALAQAEEALQALEHEAEAAVADVHERIIKGAAALSEARVAPRKAGVVVVDGGLLWRPRD